MFNLKVKLNKKKMKIIYFKIPFKVLAALRGFTITWRDTQAVMRTMCIRGHKMRLIWARHKDHRCDSQKWVCGAQHYHASLLVSRSVCSQPLPSKVIAARFTIRDVPIPKFEPIPILNFKAKPILNRYRYLDFSVLKLFIYTAFYSKGDTSRTGHS